MSQVHNVMHVPVHSLPLAASSTSLEVCSVSLIYARLRSAQRTNQPLREEKIVELYREGNCGGPSRGRLETSKSVEDSGIT